IPVRHTCSSCRRYPMQQVATDFARAIDALFAPSDFAWSLFFESDGEDPSGVLMDCRSVVEPSKLPQFWLAHCPAWFNPEPFEASGVGFVPLHGEKSRKKTHRYSSNVWDSAQEDLECPLVEGDTFPIF